MTLVTCHSLLTTVPTSSGKWLVASDEPKKLAPIAALASPYNYSSLVTRHCLLERETGIEPATNSLEGCDSTTELLPPPTAVMSG